MTEFFNLPVLATPQGDDQVLLVRNSFARRSTVAALIASAGQVGNEPSFFHIGPTAPTDSTKVLWYEASVTGEIIGQWQRSGNLWLSDQTFAVSSFTTEVNGDAFTTNPNPIPGAQIWIERFSARGLLVDPMGSGNQIDFKLSLVNLAQSETSFFFVRLQGPRAINSLINLSEPVHQVVNAENSIGLWFRSQRTGSMKMKFLTMSIFLRRIYAP